MCIINKSFSKFIIRQSEMEKVSSPKEKVSSPKEKVSSHQEVAANLYDLFIKHKKLMCDKKRLDIINIWLKNIVKGNEIKKTKRG